MKKGLFTLLTIAFLLSACDTWGVQPQPFPVWTPIPSRTPGVVTATPIIILPTFTETSTPGDIIITPTITETPSPTFTLAPITPSETATLMPIQSISVDILGCNTSIDIIHGMGEVTNAYVTVKNTGTVDLPNTCSLLRALDEDREHPDKRKCVSNLPAQNQVTLKLTVDSAYQQDTVIQVDTTSNEVMLLRVDKSSCTDIGLFGGEPSDIGVIKPIQP
ncbi:MAG: hypothetical protein HY863_12330 [Chloroflexi bacterium]|nr:hypothetical protein [Chloroflexota bacterium]